MCAVRVSLVPYADDHVERVARWFDDEDTVRWLGGPDWPVTARRMLEQRPGEVFRGARVLATFGYVVVDDGGDPLGYVGGDVYDRPPEAGAAQGTAVGLPGPPTRTAGVALVVAPQVRRRGIGTAALTALTAHPDLQWVERWQAGIEPDNTASIRTFTAAGYAAVCGVVDAEGMLTFVR